MMSSLEVGKLANFVVLKKNPRVDLMASLGSVQRVIKRGQPYLRNNYTPIDADALNAAMQGH